jgi:hypothetical protein
MTARFQALGRRGRWSLAAAALGGLVLVGTAGATHAGPLQLGHSNTGPSTTSLVCAFNERCLQVTNNSTGNLAYAGNFNSNSGAAAAIRATAFNNSYGVWGLHNSADGTYAGVFGETKSDDADAVGVFGRVNPTNSNSTSAGVKGVNNGSGPGVWGQHVSTDAFGYGVLGTAPASGIWFGGSSGHGVVGRTAQSPISPALPVGVWGDSGGGMGVMGTSGGDYGVYGITNNSMGSSIFGTTVFGAQYAVRSNGNAIVEGNLNVTGTLTKGGGAFKIDHPLAPATKYLSHSFVESPDMMNVYNGNVTTDENGFATVKLPAYFGALNKDFRYQLTILGTRGWRARVVEKIRANRFRVQTDEPNVEVSWQVTGIRNDAYAKAHRIQVEELKATSEKGKYLHPELHGAKRSLNVHGTDVAAKRR